MRRAAWFVALGEVKAKPGAAAEMITCAVSALPGRVAWPHAACAVGARRRALKSAFHVHADELTRSATKGGLAGFAEFEVGGGAEVEREVAMEAGAARER